MENIALLPIRAYIWETAAHAWIPLAYQPYDVAPSDPYKRGELPPELDILTWNVDAYSPNRRERMRLLLDTCAYYLRARPGHAPNPSLVCLQEVGARQLREILSHRWVREHFAILGAAPTSDWPAGAYHGCVALLARSVPFARAYAAHFGGLSRQQRGALVIDVLMQGRKSSAVVVRVATAHLESGGGSTDKHLRAWQAAAIAGHVCARGGAVGGIVLGDMNAVSKADDENLSRAGFVDAWSTASLAEPKLTAGYTWWPRMSAVRAGQERIYPPARFDRILRVPWVKAVEVRRVRRVAAVPMDDGEQVSDHCGLLGKVRIRPRCLA